jgi:hypothetical protein
MYADEHVQCVLVDTSRKERYADARFVGLEGTAEPAAPLSEEETFGGGQAAATPDLKDSVGGTDKTPLNDHEGEVLAELGDKTADGLSLLWKLALGGAILGSCFAWVRWNSPRAGRAYAGRHGAYEKGGLA